MEQIPVDVTGVRFTALLQLYLRWLDSKERHPTLGDPWASQVVRRLAYDFSQLASRSGDLGRYNAGPRSALMDDWVRGFLSKHPESNVLDLGCGFDSRVFRVDPDPSHHWYDVDLPDIIEIWRQLYPERAGHSAIGVSVLDPDWLSQIPGDRPVIVVADGLFMFLTEDEVQQIFRQLVGHFLGGEIVFNTYSSLLTERSRTHPTPLFAEHGVTLTWAVDDARAVETFHPRLRLVEERVLEPSLFPHAPLHIRALFALIGTVPAWKYSGRILRYRF